MTSIFSRTINWRWVPFFVCAVSFYGPTYSAELELSDVTKNLIESVIHPSTVSFSHATAALNKALRQDCSSNDAQAAFKQTIKQFSLIEILRIGVMNQDNRAERLFFWPDRKGIGQRQLRKLLSDTEREAITLNALQKKSVALQGLYSIESVLLSGKTISDADCQFVEVVSANVAQISAELEQDWQTESGVSAALLNPHESGRYRTETESLSALFTLADVALENLVQRKIPFLVSGLERKGSIPNNAPFVKSELTIENLKQNLTAVKRFYELSGLAESSQIYSEFQFEYNTAMTMLAAADAASVSVADAETVIDRLNAVVIIVNNLRSMLDRSFVSKFGLQPGFNASDGD